jgi:oxygen-independent coproporphyrinogen-3 oxidase
VPNGEYSIEVDPRKVDEATVALLAELGFNRMSVGVQDFDPDVQKAVHRVQSEEETELVIDAARAHGFKSINVDLIYGLPKQNVISFNRTLEEVLRLSPDRLSIYNYAHLPSLFKPQRRIADASCPPASQAADPAAGDPPASEAGYVYIGMDHFAKPTTNWPWPSARGGCTATSRATPRTPSATDGLRRVLHRQGRPDLQPEREDARRVLRHPRQRRLPVLRGIELTPDDLLRRSIIQALMCHFELSIEAIEIAHLIDFKRYFAAEIADLREMEKGGLLKIDDSGSACCRAGRMLVRAIAMVFDRYLRADRERTRYSKVI